MRSEIFEEINKEREYQDTRWGTTADDTLNKPNDFISYMSHCSTKWFPGGFVPYDKETVDAFRTSMIKTAAIAVAAVESLDRQRSTNGHTNYEGVRE